MAETPYQKEIRSQQEVLDSLMKGKAAGAEGVAAGQAYVDSLGGLQAEGLTTLQEAGSADVREARMRGAEGISKAVGGAQRTGLGARMASVGGAVAATDRKLATAGALQAEKEAGLRV